MKLEVLQENLSKAITLASRFTSFKAQLPVLANIMLSGKKNKLFISATNLEISVNLTIGAKVEKEGEITVPARILNEIVNNLNPGTINFVGEKERLEISTNGFKSSISGMNASDFPEIPQSISGTSIILPNDDFSACLSKVLFAVSSDETRPILTGVLFMFKKKKLYLVATDGFRLSQKVMMLGKESDIEKIILPKTVLSEVSRMIGDEDIQFASDKKNNQIIFGFENTILASRILEGDYPDYEKIIPKESQLNINVNRDDLLQAVKLASVFARDSANIVKLEIEKKGMGVFSESQYSGSQKTYIEAKVEGFTEKKVFEIAFNYRFLEELLQALKGESVQIQFSTPNSPGVFTDPEDKDFLHLIMPVKLQD